MYCDRCGKQIDDGTKFCPYCGAIQTDLPPDVDNKKPGMSVGAKVGIALGTVAVIALIAAVGFLVLPRVMGRMSGEGSAAGSVPSEVGEGVEPSDQANDDSKSGGEADGVGADSAEAEEDSAEAGEASKTEQTGAETTEKSLEVKKPTVVKVNSEGDTSSTTAETEDESASSVAQAASFPLTWTGTYVGYSQYAKGGSTVRTIKFEFSSITESGSIRGICYIGVNDPDAGTGSYYVEGNIDWKTRAISLRGTEWYKQEDVKYMRTYDGTISADFNYISGSCKMLDGTHPGDWTMQSY